MEKWKTCLHVILKAWANNEKQEYCKLRKTYLSATTCQACSEYREKEERNEDI